MGVFLIPIMFAVVMLAVGAGVAVKAEIDKSDTSRFDHKFKHHSAIGSHTPAVPKKDPNMNSTQNPQNTVGGDNHYKGANDPEGNLKGENIHYGNKEFKNDIQAEGDKFKVFNQPIEWFKKESPLYTSGVIPLKEGNSALDNFTDKKEINTSKSSLLYWHNIYRGRDLILENWHRDNNNRIITHFFHRAWLRQIPRVNPADNNNIGANMPQQNNNNNNNNARDYIEIQGNDDRNLMEEEKNQNEENLLNGGGYDPRVVMQPGNDLSHIFLEEANRLQNVQADILAGNQGLESELLPRVSVVGESGNEYAPLIDAHLQPFQEIISRRQQQLAELRAQNLNNDAIHINANQEEQLAEASTRLLERLEQLFLRPVWQRVNNIVQEGRRLGNRMSSRAEIEQFLRERYRNMTTAEFALSIYNTVVRVGQEVDRLVRDFNNAYRAIINSTNPTRPFDRSSQPQGGSGDGPGSEQTSKISNSSGGNNDMSIKDQTMQPYDTDQIGDGNTRPFSEVQYKRPQKRKYDQAFRDTFQTSIMLQDNKYNLNISESHLSTAGNIPGVNPYLGRNFFQIPNTEHLHRINDTIQKKIEKLTGTSVGSGGKPKSEGYKPIIMTKPVFGRPGVLVRNDDFFDPVKKFVESRYENSQGLTKKIKIHINS